MKRAGLRPGVRRDSNVDSIRPNACDASDSWEDRFADETLAVVCHALGAEWGSFYRLGNNLRPFAFRNRGIPQEFGTVYSRKVMEQVDPLHPFRLVPRRKHFLMMGDARLESPEPHRDFLSFLRSFGAEEAGEMIFRTPISNSISGSSGTRAFIGRRAAPRAATSSPAVKWK
jgi:hypothetical protein